MRRACCARYPHWIGIDKTLAHRWRFWPIETKSHRSYVANAYRRSQPRPRRGSAKRESCILTSNIGYSAEISPHSIDEKDPFKKPTVRFPRCVSRARSLIVQLYGNCDVHPRIIAGDFTLHIFSWHLSTYSPTFLLRVYLDSANLVNISDATCYVMIKLLIVISINYIYIRWECTCLSRTRVFLAVKMLRKKIDSDNSSMVTKIQSASVDMNFIIRIHTIPKPPPPPPPPATSWSLAKRSGRTAMTTS